MIGAYTHYFQKSKIFLYPLLGIRKGEDYVPTETYICWDNLYDVNRYKYIIIYNTERTLEFKLFEDKVLKFHKDLDWSCSLSKDKQLYVFDYSKHNHDFEMFVKGKYSKLSLETKNKILNYFGKVGKISSYIKSYLDPEKYHAVYAEALLVDLKTIQDVYEICTIPDIEKETLFEKIPDEISLLKENSIHLGKTNK